MGHVSQLGFPLPLRSSYYSPKPLQQYLPGCANLKSYPERSRSGKIGVRWVVKFLYFKKFFEMAIDGKLWQIRVGQQTYSSGIGPRYRLAIYGREMDQTFPQHSVRIRIGNETILCPNLVLLPDVVQCAATRWNATSVEFM